MLNAKEARAKTEKSLIDSMDSRTKEILLREIELSIKQGIYEAELPSNISFTQNELDYLRSLGYTLTHLEDALEDDDWCYYWHISWK